MDTRTQPIFATERTERSGPLTAVASPGPLPEAIERRLILWVLGPAAFVFIGGVFIGRLVDQEVHPIAWLAAGAVAWSAVFYVAPWRRLGFFLLGVAAAMGIVQLVVSDPRSFPIAVTILVVALVLAFPFSPAFVRTPAVVSASIVLFLVAPTGGPDPVTAYAVSLAGTMATVIGYRLLSGLEAALRRSEEDRRALLEVVDHAPVVGMVVDLSEAAHRISGLAPVSFEHQVEDPDFLIDVYRSGRVTWVNDTGRSEFGLAEDPSTLLLGSDVAATDLETIRSLVQAVRDGDRYVTSIAELPSADGDSRWFYSNWVVPPERLDRSVLVASEVTEVVRARKQLERLIDDKNRFLATISHELRTPLTAVLGFAQEAAAMAPDTGDSPLPEFLALVNEQAEEMSFIIEDLLTAARADAGSLTIEPRPLDIGDLARRLVAAARTSVALDVEGHVAAIADPVRVRQILRNLISNAVRYGGASRSVSVFSMESAIHIEVSNDGPPVPPDMVEAIFEPFVSAHAPATVTGSIGLGLAVSRQLARMMAGDLTYVRRGDMTVFRLSLPAVEEA